MTTYFVTRHTGALDWASGQGLAVDVMVTHLDPETIQSGDTVIGTLPIHLAAQVCQRGGRYLHLSLEIPPEQRGRELTAADLRQFGARLEAYRVIPDIPPPGQPPPA